MIEHIRACTLWNQHKSLAPRATPKRPPTYAPSLAPHLAHQAEDQGTALRELLTERPELEPPFVHSPVRSA